MEQKSLDLVSDGCFRFMKTIVCDVIIKSLNVSWRTNVTRLSKPGGAVGGEHVRFVTCRHFQESQ